MKKTVVLSAMITGLLVFSCQGPDNRSGLSEKDAAIERKVDSVLALMTLGEKIGQMNQINAFGAPTGPLVYGPTDMNDLKAGKIGSLLNLSGADRTRKAQEIAVKETRLGIPLIFGLDVIHGYRTVFPIPLAEACSWDMEMIRKTAEIAAVEATAEGLNWTFAPMVDIARDPRWGRIMEGAGEDTYLGSQIAVARVKGFQGDDLASPSTMVACVKHYAAYGAAEAGRDYNTVDMSERRLRDVYLPPFEAAAKAGAGTFMNSFNELGGIPATGNSFLVRQVLKDEWAFDGFVVSDWASVWELIPHGFAADSSEAARLAVLAGSDMEMVSSCYIKNLEKLVADGKVSEKLIDDAVRRILRVKFRLGLFDDPYRYCDTVREKTLILHPAHIAHAREIARRSIVLLKNEKSLLPLSKNLKSIAVIGPLADDHDAPLGNWRAKGEAKDVVSLLDGIKNAVGNNTRIIYEKGCEVLDPATTGFTGAVKAARSADIVIAVLGESALMSGEARSRADISLPGKQQELLEALQGTGKPVVLVLMNGRPLTLNWASEHVPAIVEAWHLGVQSGNAIADVLFGDYNPSGKLVVSFPYAVGQIPVYYNHKSTGRPITPENPWTSRYQDIPNEPLYPFGYGLSYTTFEYSNLKLDKNEMVMGGIINVTIDVTNTGKVAGEEVIQLYVRDLVGNVTRPVLELKGFKKVLLQPGETVNVAFQLSSADLAFWNNDMQFKAEPGDFNVFVGTNSDELLQASFVLK
jgi:beta-glucosidase